MENNSNLLKKTGNFLKNQYNTLKSEIGRAPELYDPLTGETFTHQAEILDKEYDSNTSKKAIKEYPLLNENSVLNNTSTVQRSYFTQPFKYKQILDMIKKTPEAIGILNALVDDILSDGYHFESEGSGKLTNKKKAEDFAEKNFFKNEMKGAMLDFFMLGNSALWTGQVNPSQIVDMVKEHYAQNKLEIKEHQIDWKEYIDEGGLLKVKHVAWSTMDIMHDNKKILGYKQNVSGTFQNYRPEEIIHGKFMNFDGKVHGYTPMIANMSILSTLSLIKDMNGNFFENGGVPDWMFILPNEMANSPNVKSLEQKLAMYKRSSQSRGNMIFTGEVRTEQMNRFDKDMEFKDLALYYTGILALSFNMPMSRVATILGMKGGKAGNEDLANEGYWRKISEVQDYWEQLLNTQLFMPHFDVKIKFNRNYKQDEIRETQNLMQSLDLYDRLFNVGAITDEYFFMKMKIPDKYRGKLKTPEERMEAQQQAGGEEKEGFRGTKNQKDDRQVLKGPNQNIQDNKKKDQQLNKKETKENSSFYEVSLIQFKDLVEKYVKKSKTRKVNYNIKEGVIRMYLDLPESKYKCIISETNISDVEKSDLLGNSIRVV